MCTCAACAALTNKNGVVSKDGGASWLVIMQQACCHCQLVLLSSQRAVRGGGCLRVWSIGWCTANSRANVLLTWCAPACLSFSNPSRMLTAWVWLVRHLPTCPAQRAVHQQQKGRAGCAAVVGSSGRAVWSLPVWFKGAFFPTWVCEVQSSQKYHMSW